MKKTTKKSIKSTFDKDGYVFETEITVLEAALAARMEELVDLLEYQQPDSEQRKRINDLKYWLGIWECYLPEAKRRGMKTVPTSARENAILGMFEKSKKGKKK